MSTRGSQESRTRHSPVWGPVGFMMSMAIPAAIAIIGIIVLGWGEISWLGAIVWGVVATIAFTLFSIMGGAIGMTSMDLLDLLGSMVAPPGSTASQAIGAMIHHTNGALLAIG